MNETRKWIFHRISAVILAPLYTWLFISLILLSTKGYSQAIYFLKNPLFVILTIIVFFVGFFHAKISLSEIFEDYISNIKIRRSLLIVTKFMSYLLATLGVVSVLRIIFESL